jgi:hypothetical protein
LEGDKDVCGLVGASRLGHHQPGSLIRYGWLRGANPEAHRIDPNHQRSEQDTGYRKAGPIK